MVSFPALTENNAFYRQNDYVESTISDLYSPIAIQKLSHYYNTEISLERHAIKAICFLIPPYGIYKAIHLIAGMTVIIPAATPSLSELPPNYVNQARREIPLEENWKIKRITIKTNGNKIDAMIMGTPASLTNKRWVLYSGGNGEFYETSIRSHSLREFLKLTKSNLIVFNYPGVGCSTGTVTKKTLTTAYKAVLHFLEDPLAIEAREIIAYGYSMGAAIQGEVLFHHRLKPRIKYAFIKSHSFSELSTAARYLTCRSVAVLTKLFNWNLRPIKSSLMLNTDEIILQTGDVPYAIESNNSKFLSLTDGMIHHKASLTKKMLEYSDLNKDKKHFILVPEDHFTQLCSYSTQLLASKTLSILNKAS